MHCIKPQHFAPDSLRLERRTKCLRRNIPTKFKVEIERNERIGELTIEFGAMIGPLHEKIIQIQGAI